jgi:hypothetical protein
VQPGIQQDHVFDAGKPHPASILSISRVLQYCQLAPVGYQASDQP